MGVVRVVSQDREINCPCNKKLYDMLEGEEWHGQNRAGYGKQKFCMVSYKASF